MLTNVAFATALLAAAVSLIQLLVLRRNTRELETLKSELHEEQQRRTEYFRRYLEAVAQGHERELTAFRELLAAGQKIRDQLRLVSEYPDTFDPKILATELNTLASAVLTVYAANQLHFAETDRAVAHEFKTLASGAAAQMATLLSGSAARGAFDVGEQQARLTATHAKLRDAAVQAARRYGDRLRVESETYDD